MKQRLKSASILKQRLIQNLRKSSADFVFTAPTLCSVSHTLIPLQTHLYPGSTFALHNYKYKSISRLQLGNFWSKRWSNRDYIYKPSVFLTFSYMISSSTPKTTNSLVLINFFFSLRYTHLYLLLFKPIGSQQ